MTARDGLFLAGAVVLLATLALALAELPALGDPGRGYGALVVQVGRDLLGVLNMATAVNVGFRALDTLGEELVLLTGVASVSLLLREARAGEDRPEEETLSIERTAPTQWLAPWPPLLLLTAGIGLVAYGHLSPGGGFQGGVILAAAVLSLYLSLGFGAFSRAARPQALDALEAGAVAGYVVVGLAGLWRHGSFLADPLPTGTPGTLLSGGMAPLLNALIGLAVAAGMILILLEFLQEIVAPSTEPPNEQAR